VKFNPWIFVVGFGSVFSILICGKWGRRDCGKWGEGIVENGEKGS
jgi:hypothetical protein